MARTWSVRIFVISATLLNGQFLGFAGVAELLGNRGHFKDLLWFP